MYLYLHFIFGIMKGQESAMRQCNWRVSVQKCKQLFYTDFILYRFHFIACYHCTHDKPAALRLSEWLGCLHSNPSRASDSSCSHIARVAAREPTLQCGTLGSRSLGPCGWWPSVLKSMPCGGGGGGPLKNSASMPAGNEMRMPWPEMSDTRNGPKERKGKPLRVTFTFWSGLGPWTLD